MERTTGKRLSNTRIALACAVATACGGGKGSPSAAGRMDTGMDAGIGSSGGAEGGLGIPALDASSSVEPSCVGQTQQSCDDGGGSQVDASCSPGSVWSDEAGGMCVSAGADAMPSSQGIDGPSGAGCSVAETSQDPANCGACGNACPSAQVSRGMAVGVALDSSNLYWADSNGNVTQVPLRGGTPVSLASSSSISAGAVAVDATNVYWTDPSGGTVMKTAIGGGTPTALASGQSSPTAIAADGTNVYWTNKGTSANNFRDGAVLAAPSGGGTITTLASNQDTPVAIAVDANNVYWANWGFANPGTVEKIPRTGGTPATLFTGRGPDAIAVDASNVYFTDDGLGTVMKLPLNGALPILLAQFTTTFSHHPGIAVDATTVYFTDSSAGTVMAASIQGGAAVTLASAQTHPSAIAVQNGEVYWATDGGVSGTGCQGGLCKCPAGQAGCAGTCVDTSSDSANCGACGAVCSPPRACKGGLCTCTSNADCSNQACVNSTCSGDCAPAALRCNANQLQTCDDSGTWSVTSVCPMGCRSDGSAKCRDCQSGDTNCNGITLQSCDSTGAFVDGAACPSACIAGQCVQGSQCNYGDGMCVASGEQRCSTDGTWAMPVACDPNATCTAGACVGPAACNSLRSCCYAISIDPTNCINLTRMADGSTCQSVLSNYRSEGICF